MKILTHRGNDDALPRFPGPGDPGLRLSSSSTSAASAPDGGEESVRARLLTPHFSDGLLSKQTPGDAKGSPAPFTSAGWKHVSPAAYPPPRDRVTTGRRRRREGKPRFFLHARGKSTNIPRAAARSFRACVNMSHGTTRGIVSWYTLEVHRGTPRQSVKCLAPISRVGLVDERNRKCVN